MYGVALTLAILAMMVLVLLAVEVQSFRRGRTLISRRRLTLRVVAGVLLLSLIIAVFLGLFVLGLSDGHRHPRMFLAYWSMCLLAAVALVWVMLADLQEVEDSAADRQREIWRDMARLVGEQMRSGKQQDTGGESEKPE